jgi:hypothetical protein
LQFASERGEDDDEKKEKEEDNFDCVNAAALHHASGVLEMVRLREKGFIRLGRGEGFALRVIGGSIGLSCAEKWRAAAHLTAVTVAPKINRLSAGVAHW